MKRALSLYGSVAPVLFVILLAAVAPGVNRLFDLDPLRPDMLHVLNAPSHLHWFGTDNIGRDVFARVLAAARLDLGMALGGVAIAALIGITVGTACLGLGGLADRLTQRVVDVLMAFPLFVVALALAAVFGNTVWSVVLATAIINVPFYARLSRAELLVHWSAPYVAAARLAGWREPRIVLLVLLPNILPALTVQMTVNLAWAMLNGAALSFLGLGIRPPAAEWGLMVADGASYMMTGQWWLVAFPGLALCLTVLSLSLAGEKLRDRFDPRRH